MILGRKARYPRFCVPIGQSLSLERGSKSPFRRVLARGHDCGGEFSSANNAERTEKDDD